MIKTGKEIKTELFNNYNIVYGSVNNKNPKAIYINVSSWGLPLDAEENNYIRIIKDINKKVKQTLYNYISNNLKDIFIKEQSIVDLDIRKSGIKLGKRSFINCEITLYLHEPETILSERIKIILDKLINHIIKESFEANTHFKFYKKKI